MRVLVLGAGGMLGHKLLQRLSQDHDVAGAVRAAAVAPDLKRVLGGIRVLTGVDGTNLDTVEAALREHKPEVVFNCIGVIKQLKEAKDPIISIETNSLLPHRIAKACAAHGAHFVHFSTDCVFSGREGNYTEGSVSDCIDLYGRTKYLGEVTATGALTIRTSIIGRELRSPISLVDWFLCQRAGRIKGFAGAIYTGLTTNAMADLMAKLLAEAPVIEGLWQVSADPISKYDLLNILNDVYQAGVTIDRDETFFCDRSLDSSRFRTRLGWTPPSWQEMVIAMHADPTNYDGVGYD